MVKNLRNLLLKRSLYSDEIRFYIRKLFPLWDEGKLNIKFDDLHPSDIMNLENVINLFKVFEKSNFNF